jgi:peptidoglycan/xylan/chitin deacetylase (PgdA/CDA1 family)/GT2 family glycosyltransferase
MGIETSHGLEPAHISIIVPTYNRVERLRACLAALEAQVHPGLIIEVIVVIDGSTDDTAALLVAGRWTFRLKVLRQTRSGQSMALNTGLAAAEGRYCLFLDDDIVACPDLVAAHWRAHQADARKIVTLGQMTLRVRRDAGWYVREYAASWLDHYLSLNHQQRTPTWADAWSGNLMAPRESLLQSCGFATDLPRGFDVELAYRLHKMGLRFVYVAEALGEQDERKDNMQLARAMVLQGLAAFQISQRHPETGPLLLGDFGKLTPRATLWCHLLLALPISPRWLLQILPEIGRHLSGQQLFQFLSHCLFWRGVKSQVKDPVVWRQLTDRGVTILMYHAFGHLGEPASRFILPADRFARQMAWLKLTRRRVISLGELMDYRRANRWPPIGSVVVTIDDGYADSFQIAWPILCRHGFPATFFLVTNRIGEQNRWDTTGELVGRPLMDGAAIRLMQQEGASFGAHTRTHPRLTTLSLTEAWVEIAQCKYELECILGQSIDLFCYPYGDFNSEIQTLTAEAGFAAACTCQPGPVGPATEAAGLNRVEVRGTDSLLQFALKVWRGE